MSTHDPDDRVRAALEAAREARGATEEEEPPLTVDPRNPYSAAEAALRKAEEARKAAEGTRGRAEDRARKELERLKALAGAARTAIVEPDAAEGAAEEEDIETEPRIRRRL